MRKYFFEKPGKIREYLLASIGKIKPSIILKNALIIDVYSGDIHGGNIVIYKDRIVGIRKEDVEAELEVDVKGKYVAPGFMDAHIHIESTLLAPPELSKILLPHGVTSVFADPHELANVLGIKGIKLLFKMSRDIPLRVFIEVPSRVPTAPGLETTGAQLNTRDVRKLLKTTYAVSLGELNYQNVLYGSYEYLEKIVIADELGLIVNGHMAGLKDELLDAVISAGLVDDHECISYEEAIERVRRGCAVMVREGSTERNLENVIKAADKVKDTRKFLMCTDDKHPDDILVEGHIDFNVRKAVEHGVDPVKAIQMATLNIAQHFGLEYYIGSIAPLRKADIVILDDLEKVKVNKVIFDGKIAYSDGKVLWNIGKVRVPKWALRTVKINPELHPKDLLITVNKQYSKAFVRVMKVIENQIVVKEEKVWLSVKEGIIASDVERDVLHIAVVERHKGLRNIGKTFVRGFNIKNGAIGSTVAHDHHNVVIVGDNANDMFLAVKELERMGGGFIVTSKHRVLAKLPLPIAGLISAEKASTVVEKIHEVSKAAQSLGCTLKKPFMQLSFITLPTVPELGLTDKGLIDSRKYKVISPIITLT